MSRICLIAAFALAISLTQPVSSQEVSGPGFETSIYWDETSRPLEDPILVEKVRVGNNEHFHTIKSCNGPSFGQVDLAYWIGGRAHNWQPLQEGHRTAWIYTPESDEPYVWFKLSVGRFQVSGSHEVTSAFGLPEWVGQRVTWRCISRMNHMVRLLPPPEIDICMFRNAEELLASNVGGPAEFWHRLHPNGIKFEAPKRYRLELHERNVRLDHTGEGIHTNPGDQPINISGAMAWCFRNG